MFLAILIVFGALLIVFAALRIILSWLLSRETMAQLDRFVGTTMKLIMQLAVLFLAGIICYVVYLGWKD